MPDAMVVKCYACGTFQVVKQHLPMQNRFTCKVTQCKIEQPMNAFADKGVVLRSYDVREMVAAAKRLNAEKLEQRSKGVLSHQKDRIMQELNEKLGVLVILIVKDPAGYELCLVSSETFFPSVVGATNYEGPDWGHRRVNSSQVAPA